MENPDTKPAYADEKLPPKAGSTDSAAETEGGEGVPWAHLEKAPDGGLEAWLVIRPGAIIFVFAIMMTSLCKEYWQFMLAQGLLLGLGMGLMVFPAMTAVSQFFDKKRAAALGLTVSGSSIGGIVMPIILSKMLRSSLGFGWSPLVPDRTVQGPHLRAPDRGHLLHLRRHVYPAVLPSSYAVHRGINANLASYMLAILNGASTFGRIVPGILADKFGRVNILAIAGLVNGIVIFCFNEVTGTAGIVVYAVFFGAPFNGMLMDRYHGYFEVAMFSGAMCLFGGILVLFAKKATGKGMLALI
ncbi:unnamed protein product [Parascedosporium putredinis]|uniref:Monocarboxylate transporter n=1 Tax=Parascedosporium putredinis TaxID=1442378 RepID=A0A9P1MEM1_9PEZI|nr:unnamed protein product [Parascedosporium putredinis]CAI8004884.1 unnamed protein product [Parascedosporium putredinis]